MTQYCSPDPCPVLLNSTCVFYTGEDLLYIGVNTNDNLQVVIQKINQAFTNSGIGYGFTNGIIQPTISSPVQLGGALIQNTTIGGNFTLEFTGNLKAAKHITTGGTASQFVKGDGTLDSTSYQPAGNYITSLTGDGTASGPGAAAFTLATVNGAPGTFGAGSSIPVITVNAKGLVTNLTATALVVPPQPLTFIGDVVGSGFTGSPVTLLLQNVNLNVYPTITALKVAINAKGLVTAASPITAGDIATILGYTPGTVSSVGLTVPSAFSVANSPVTTSGTINITAIGTSSQYIKGDGSLAALPITTSGSSGSSGSSGTSSTGGTSGTNGSAGTSGSSGSSGSSGTTGTSGTAGTSGSSGQDGISGGQIYYLNESINTSSAFGTPTYKQWSPAPSGGAQQSFTTNIAGAATQTLQTYATDSGVPGVTFIPAGQWAWTLHVQLNNGAADFEVYVEVYKWDGTTGTLLGTTNIINLTYNLGLIQQIYVDTFLSSISLSNTDRVYCKIIAQNITGSPYDIIFYTEGNTYYSYSQTTFNAPSGTSGTSGTTGTSGSSGTTGTSGSSGSSGTDGTGGTSGTSGSSGNSGTSGTSGSSGSTGSDGTSGSSGTDGTGGSSGTSGTSGLTGSSGTTGTSGTSGTTGVSGTSGTSGTAGTSGANGATGSNGTSGTSGINVGSSAVIILGAGACSSVRDGVSNVSSGDYSFAGGGQSNQAQGCNSFIGGGRFNTVSSDYGSVISGGDCNTICATAPNSTISGGYGNTVNAPQGFIGEGNSNTITGGGGGSFIGSGNYNTVCGSGQTIINGQNNLITGGFGSSIGFGLYNISCDSYLSTIVSGSDNCIINGCYATIINGSQNTIDGVSCEQFIGGGFSNKICNTRGSFIGTGFCNTICSNVAFQPSYPVIVGGFGNSISSASDSIDGSSIVGGVDNNILGTTGSACISFIGGGNCNRICDVGISSIVGGSSNTINCNGFGSFIGGGINNNIRYNVSFIGGGSSNTASGNYSFIGGGCGNIVSGNYAFIGGGCKNIAQGVNSFIGGGNCNNVCNSTSGCLAYGAVVAGGVGNNTTGGTWALASCAFTVAPTICNAGSMSFVGSGFQNIAVGACSSIVGGSRNTVLGVTSSALGGFNNIVCGNCSTVLGGCGITVSGNFSAAIGCNINAPNSCTFYVNNLQASLVSGGGGVVCGAASVNSPLICGTTSMCTPILRAGTACITGLATSGCAVCVGASGILTQYTAGGGGIMIAGTGCNSTIRCGVSNTASGNCSAALGGQGNTAIGNYSFVGGGASNSVSGCYSAVLGGYVNTVSGHYSGAFGSGLTNVHDCSFMANRFFADNLAPFVGSVLEIGTDGEIIPFFSDSRLKTNICNIEYGLGDVKKLNPVSFNWNEEASKTRGYRKQLGFIAQEVKLIIPEAVGESNDENTALSLNPNQIIPILTKAIQELAEKNISLEDRISKLEQLALDA